MKERQPLARRRTDRQICEPLGYLDGLGPFGLWRGSDPSNEVLDDPFDTTPGDLSPLALSRLAQVCQTLQDVPCTGGAGGLNSAYLGCSVASIGARRGREKGEREDGEDPDHEWRSARTLRDNGGSQVGPEGQPEPVWEVAVSVENHQSKTTPASDGGPVPIHDGRVQ